MAVQHCIKAPQSCKSRADVVHVPSQMAAHPKWAAWSALMSWHGALCLQSASSHVSTLAAQRCRLLHGFSATSPLCIVSISLVHAQGLSCVCCLLWGSCSWQPLHCSPASVSPPYSTGISACLQGPAAARSRCWHRLCGLRRLCLCGAVAGLEHAHHLAARAEGPRQYGRGL